MKTSAGGALVDLKLGFDNKRDRMTSKIEKIRMKQAQQIIPKGYKVVVEKNSRVTKEFLKWLRRWVVEELIEEVRRSTQKNACTVYDYLKREVHRK